MPFPNPPAKHKAGIYDSEQQLLFSISMYTPPKAAQLGRSRGGGAAGGDGGIIGGRLASEMQEQVSLEERHERVCRFVSVVHG